ncbi:HutD/Ves family protein [Nocardioides zeae]|uniref:Environmental stress-induced protein Ves n=1 Tax=Nocardioides zeae TaxID=1457234 RepID=A0AAJ1U1W6_9ACTN|nr:HutD family protein [Nocardioides zeae]MDQ1102752.1 environmental stress-induced protein Ves [Nocardioides zeae]
MSLADLGGLPAVPWRNGAGLTRELAAHPDGAWRVSVAAIAGPAPWSAFPGVDRVSCVVAGEGLVLTVDGAEQSVRRGEVLAYRGESVVLGRPLGGPVQNLNLVLARGRAVGGLRVVELAGFEPGADDVLLWALDGSGGGGGRAVVVSAAVR